MDDKSVLLAIINDETRRHPWMRATDLRKLIVQSVLGGDHLLSEGERFRDGLRREWERIPPVACSAALQPIDPGGRIARLHLACCRAVGTDVEALTDLLLSQPKASGRWTDVEARWRDVLGLAAAGRIPFSADALDELSASRSIGHHSADYGFASYRVVNDLTHGPFVGGLRVLGLIP